MDEVGTPFCITVDFDSLKDGTVTIRDRDSTRQKRVPADGIAGEVGELVAGRRSLLA
jgi:glycyl-tRNA synthetase